MNLAQNEDQPGKFPQTQNLSARFQRAPLLAAILAAMVFLWGCAGVVSGQNTQPSSPSPTQSYSISGTISPAAGGNGATVTLSGAASATTTANSSGSYTFTGVADGTYTVTPSRLGYTFTPGNRTAVVSGANVTAADFTATAQTFGISGTISPAAGGNGATVTLSGAASATTTANSSGNYAFSGLANGTYAVTPSRTGYTFSPSVQAATLNDANITGLNFTATAQVGSTFSISGTISPTAGGAGATVLLSGTAGATTVTNSAGNYTFIGLANGSYTATPNNPGFTFTPASQNVTVTTNVPGVNFTAAAQQTHSVALTWNASTSTVLGYNVYRSTVSGSGYAREIG